MEAILLGVMMLAIGWLVVWFCNDRSKPDHTWWPFDYRTRDEEKPAPNLPDRQRTRHNPTRPWKRSAF